MAIGRCGDFNLNFCSRYSLLKAATSMFPSLMSSLMNLFVRSSSISWHVMRSLKSGLSRNESVNSRVGSPMVPEVCSASSASSPSLWGVYSHRCGGILQPHHLCKLLLLLHFLTSACVVGVGTFDKSSGGVTPAGWTGRD